MSKERTVIVDRVGEVYICRKKGVRRLSIRINSSSEVRMTIPYLISYSQAERFLKEKIDWIIKTREKIKLRIPEKKLYNVDELIETKFHRITIKRTTAEKAGIKYSGNNCILHIPENLLIESDYVQVFIRKGIAACLRKEAKQFLIPRLERLSSEHGYRYTMVRFKDMKTRWGSCSVKNNINLNIHLMRIPENLADYVILHELVHTIRKNHGPGFWADLERCCPGSKQLSKELRKYRAVS
jgi:predicted metal-dependent hydrolase